jgi:hypothetical protein
LKASEDRLGKVNVGQRLFKIIDDEKEREALKWGPQKSLQQDMAGSITNRSHASSMPSLPSYNSMISSLKNSNSERELHDTTHAADTRTRTTASISKGKKRGAASNNHDNDVSGAGSDPPRHSTVHKKVNLSRLQQLGERQPKVILDKDKGDCRSVKKDFSAMADAIVHYGCQIALEMVAHDGSEGNFMMVIF